ncbi:subtilase-type protease inhibitor [Streptomyces graminilatus]|uniref:subtilase-type protease inhibitor n=1 Tax=Streptomyces graminilatus TaxID=1464070 RepID=UPI0006E155A9|nr:subtilase-type protease inhibitor [Streptomyces graminilatus]
MPNTARWAATLTLTATAVCAPLAGAAVAAPSGLYAPSALVLTIGHGDTAATVTPERAVTLTCAPTASGTHPAAADACSELRAADGDFGLLPTKSDVKCTKQYEPVVVTVEGVWRGQRVSYERTFANECVKSTYGTALFAF